MTSLGLVERKQTSTKPTSLGLSERPINPDDETSFASVIEANPNVAMSHIRQQVLETWYTLQKGFKFILKEKRRRLQLGVEAKRQNNFLHLKWLFYEIVRGVSGEEEKKRYALVDQRVFPFFPFFEQKEVKVRLRTTKNETVVEELVTLASRQGISIVPLGPCAGASILAHDNGGLAVPEDALERSLLEQKLREEAEAKELSDRKVREQEELAACSPLPFAEPPLFDDQGFLDSGSIFLGGVNEEDLTRPLDGLVEESVSRTFEIEAAVEEDRVPTEEEMNEIGKEVYRKDEIHKQIMMALSHATKYFPLYISVTSPGGLDGKAEAKVQQSVYLISDAQEVYENNYSKIATLKQMVVKFFPLSQLIEREGKYQKSQLWIRDFLTGDLIPLSNPDEFSFLFDFAQKDYGTVIHKACLIANETGAVKRSLNYIQKILLEDFERTLKGFETSKRYSGTASDAKVAGPSAPSVGASGASDAPVSAPAPVSSLAYNLGTSVSAQTSRVTHYSSRPVIREEDNDSLF